MALAPNPTRQHTVHYPDSDQSYVVELFNRVGAKSASHYKKKRGDLPWGFFPLREMHRRCTTVERLAVLSDLCKHIHGRLALLLGPKALLKPFV